MVRRIAVFGDEGDPVDGEKHDQPAEAAPGGVIHVDADPLTGHSTTRRPFELEEVEIDEGERGES